MTREQALNALKSTTLSDHERESILQYLHYIQVEGVKPTSAKRPAQKTRHQSRHNDPSRQTPPKKST